jgi:HK97 family phage major capsid protein
MEVMSMNKEAILKRMKEISAELEKEGADVTALDTEFRGLTEDLNKIELRGKVLDGIKAGEIEGRKLDHDDQKDGTDATEAEKRGKALIEKRTVTIPSSSAILAEHKGTTINPTFNDVSSVIDLVDTTPVKGGESYEQPYIKGYGEGGYTEEGKDAVEAEPTFGYARLAKTKITAYAEISKEMQKLPAADYDGVVQGSMRRALNKKMAREIFLGDGTDGHYNGIFNNPTDEKKIIIETKTDIEISEIGIDTLDDIIFSYGGEENVEGGGWCVLFLNKRDLKAFAKLRSTDGKKIHDIKINGNSGTIDTIPFVISSACKAVSDAKTTAGDYCMAYGHVKNYKQVIFSDVEVTESKDFKFRQGMICYSGEVYIGGNVVAHNGFIRVKKKA